MTAEEQRLMEAADRTAHWKRWGPYLSERAWGTVREDRLWHGMGLSVPPFGRRPCSTQKTTRPWSAKRKRGSAQPQRLVHKS